MFVRHCSRHKDELGTVLLKRQSDGKVLNRKERSYRVTNGIIVGSTMEVKRKGLQVAG